MTRLHHLFAASAATLLLVGLTTSLTTAQESDTDLRQAATLDLDGDGFSDPTVYERQDDGSARQIRYTTRFSASGLTLTEEGGKKDDLIAVGDYQLNGQAAKAYARVQEDGTIRWFVEAEDGTRVRVDLGSEEDALISGCDFNGNGMSDPAVVNDNGLQVMGIDTEEVQTFPVPRTPETALVDLHCGDYTGDGVDELALVEASQEKKITRRGKERTITRYTARVLDKSGGTLLTERRRKPFGIVMADFDNDGKEELGSFSTKRSSTRRLKVRDETGVRRLRLPPFSEASAATVEGFDGAPKVGLLVAGKGSVHEVALPETTSTPVFSGLESGQSLMTSVAAITHGSVELEVGGDGCTEFQDGRDGPGGFLWKGSDHGGTLVVLFPQPLRTPFESVTLRKNGRKIADLYYTGKANGDRQHWRHNSRPGQWPRDVVVTAKLGNQVRCYQIENPGARND